jgi:hypothetical protein
MHWVAIPLLFPLLAACAAEPSSTPSPRPVSVGVAFTLKVGEVAAVEGGGVRLTFTGVPTDSRCPQGEQCIWAGDAVVSLAASGGPGGTVTLELHTNPRSGEGAGDYNPYTVTLQELAPAPRSGRMLQASDYVATLKITSR